LLSRTTYSGDGAANPAVTGIQRVAEFRNGGWHSRRGVRHGNGSVM
jgi:hypothetical protein